MYKDLDSFNLCMKRTEFLNRLQFFSSIFSAKDNNFHISMQQDFIIGRILFVNGHIFPMNDQNT